MAKELKVGDILVSSWGYEQTNVNYFQVLRITGKSVEIQGIRKHSHGEDGFMTGKCEPIANDFFGKKMMKRYVPGQSIRISSYEYASKWDGKPDRQSWYA